MEKLKVLYVTHEMIPYLQLTDMAVTARALPQLMQDKGHEVRVFMPRFGAIKERKFRLHEVIRLSGINIPIGDEDNPLIIKVASLPSAKMQIYFLDNDDYFNKRNYFEDDKGKFYADNDERLIFFNKGIIEIIMKLGWIPDIVHCIGWMSSLFPLYARAVHKNQSIFKNTQFIFSAYENGFNGTLGAGFKDKAIVNGLSSESMQFLDDPSCTDLYKTGISFVDGIVNGNTDIDDSVIEYINQQDKPILTPETGDNSVDEYYEFYQNLLYQEKVA